MSDFFLIRDLHVGYKVHRLGEESVGSLSCGLHSCVLLTRYGSKERVCNFLHR